MEDVLKAPIEIIKCAVYKKHGIEKLAPEFLEKYRDRLNVAIAGDIWLDFMNLESDKGNALRTIQKTLHILPEETMAFGDNMNDLGMLRAAGESYAVENAAEAVPFLDESGALWLCGKIYQPAGGDYHEELLPLTGYETSEFYSVLLEKLG